MKPRAILSLAAFLGIVSMLIAPCGAAAGEVMSVPSGTFDGKTYFFREVVSNPCTLGEATVTFDGNGFGKGSWKTSISSKTPGMTWIQTFSIYFIGKDDPTFFSLRSPPSVPGAPLPFVNSFDAAGVDFKQISRIEASGGCYAGPYASTKTFSLSPPPPVKNCAIGSIALVLSVDPGKNSNTVGYLVATPVQGSLVRFAAKLAVQIGGLAFGPFEVDADGGAGPFGSDIVSMTTSMAIPTGETGVSTIVSCG